MSIKTPELDLMPMSENGEKEFEYLKKKERDLERMVKHIDRIIDAYKHLDNYSETIHVQNVVEDLERIKKNQG